MSADPAIEKSSAFKQRVLSGVILAPAAAGIIVWGGWAFLLMVVAASLIALHEFVSLVQKGAHKILFTIFGTIYLAVCCGAFVFIRVGYEAGAALTLAVILCVWASDIGAYFCGKKIGGPKMAPKLSPNKTWAGLAGASVFCGFALALAFAAVPGIVVHDAGYIVKIFILGLGLGLVGQAGDLLISFFKRRVGAKDTGALIPGHGGVLDRIDSLLLVSPAFLMMEILWM
ncbi:MAG: phosphatidate cytidylyltransferase [Rhodospirillales bacterium]|nr:phosphatidate cytidylyltransferase [Rhodospirillales bacterium]MCB9995617.1 phosphatidate cytidylyltransferase [Rhodospirillales bacterium]